MSITRSCQLGWTKLTLLAPYFQLTHCSTKKEDYTKTYCILKIFHNNSQDVSQYLKRAQLDRDKEASFGRKANKSGFRKMATIPDIVAINESNIDYDEPI